MNDRCTFEELLELGRFDLNCWEDDELALKLAAESARHPVDRLTQLEKHCFPGLIYDKVKLRSHLYIRNKILQLWLIEPNIEVTWETTLTRLCEPFNKLKDTTRRIIEFLTRYGYINYGLFHRLSRPPLSVISKKIVVIGAGLAGLSAARQLRNFGFDITLLESLDRIGGRCHSSKQVQLKETSQQTSKYFFGVDFGPELISAKIGNPIQALLKQVHSTPIKVSNDIVLYDEFGKPIEAKKLDLVNDMYKKFLDSIYYLVNVKEIKSLDGEVLSVQKIFSRLLAKLEYENLKKQDSYWDIYAELLEKLKATVADIAQLCETAEMLEKRADTLTELKEKATLPEIELELLSRFQYVDMTTFTKLNDEAKERRATLLALLKDLKKNEPSAVFMNHRDKRILDWHLANLEYALGSTLDQIPAEYFEPNVGDWWNNSFGLREGFGPFINRLDFAEIHRKCTVSDIFYDENRVTVKYKRRISKERVDGEEIGLEEIVNEEKIECDAVVCAVPLGVLKKNIIKFHPELPANKQNAIEKMGFGTMNKIILVFEKAFWPQDTHFFARLNANPLSRGEFYMFIAIGNKPSLTALVGGSSAICEQSNEVISASVMNVLKSIFGSSSTPKQPKSIIITRWHEDPSFYGTNSFVKIGANSEMYDTLAEPVAAPCGSSSKIPQNRLFFAGEHTNRQLPATIEGAWLSGLRAASEVADLFIGQPFSNYKNESVNDDIPKSSNNV